MSCCATARSSNDRKSHRRGEHCYTHKSTKAFRCIMILDYYSLREYICTFFLQAGPLSLCQCGTQRYKEGYFLKFSFRCRAKNLWTMNLWLHKEGISLFLSMHLHTAPKQTQTQRDAHTAHRACMYKALRHGDMNKWHYKQQRRFTYVRLET